MQSHIEFDIDSNGEVSPEEAKEYLEDQDSVSLELFTEKIWPNIKEIYKSPEVRKLKSYLAIELRTFPNLCLKVGGEIDVKKNLWPL